MTKRAELLYNTWRMHQEDPTQHLSFGNLSTPERLTWEEIAAKLPPPRPVPPGAISDDRLAELAKVAPSLALNSKSAAEVRTIAAELAAYRGLLPGPDLGPGMRALADAVEALDHEHTWWTRGRNNGEALATAARELLALWYGYADAGDLTAELRVLAGVADEIAADALKRDHIATRRRVARALAVEGWPFEDGDEEQNNAALDAVIRAATWREDEPYQPNYVTADTIGDDRVRELMAEHMSQEGIDWNRVERYRCAIGLGLASSPTDAGAAAYRSAREACADEWNEREDRRAAAAAARSQT